jgi:hypothetical protein
MDTLCPSLLLYPDQMPLAHNPLWRIGGWGPVVILGHFSTNPPHYMPQEAEVEASKRCVVEADLAAAGQRCAEWEHKCAQLEKRLEVCLGRTREGVLVGGSEVWWCWRGGKEQHLMSAVGCMCKAEAELGMRELRRIMVPGWHWRAMVRKAWAWKQGGCNPLLASVSHGVLHVPLYSLQPLHCSYTYDLKYECPAGGIRRRVAVECCLIGSKQ